MVAREDGWAGICSEHSSLHQTIIALLIDAIFLTKIGGADA